MSTSCVPTLIYIEDMRTKEVNECAVYIQLLNESFSVKTENSNVMIAWIPLVSIFCGSGVVSGSQGKQMTP